MGTRKTRSDKGKKHKYPSTRKTSGRSNQLNNIIKVLEKTRSGLEKRLAHNKKAFAKDRPHFKAIKLNPIKERISQLNSAIESLKSKSYRPNEKNLRIFENAWDWHYKKGALIPEELVADRESNFKRLVLEELYEQGVNIYNPTELANALKGYTLDDIVNAASWAADVTDEVNAQYYAIKEDAYGYVQSIIKALKTQEKELSSILNKA